MTRVVLLNGPVGVGKTTLGRAAAAQLGMAFLDADDFRNRAQSWCADALANIGRVCAAVPPEGAIVAQALRRRDWLIYRRRLGAERVACVTLSASLAHIVTRSRALAQDEIARTARMVGEGYDARPFSDVILRTDDAGFDATVDRLVAVVRDIMVVTA